MPRWARSRLGSPVMSRPKKAIEPPSARSSPMMRLKSVVLPAPLGPMMRRRSPGSTARSTAAVTRSPPKDLARPLTASAVIASSRSSRRGGQAEHRPAPSPEARGAGHEPFRHEDDDGDEDGAQHEIPAL